MYIFKCESILNFTLTNFEYLASITQVLWIVKPNKNCPKNVNYDTHYPRIKLCGISKPAHKINLKDYLFDKNKLICYNYQ